MFSYDPHIPPKKKLSNKDSIEEIIPDGALKKESA